VSQEPSVVEVRDGLAVWCHVVHGDPRVHHPRDVVLPPELASRRLVYMRDTPNEPSFTGARDELRMVCVDDQFSRLPSLPRGPGRNWLGGLEVRLERRNDHSPHSRPDVARAPMCRSVRQLRRSIGQYVRVEDPLDGPSVCRCEATEMLVGDEATAYREGHLRLIERGRSADGDEDWQCPDHPIAWVVDWPSRHWAEDHRGKPRLRRLPLPPGAPPVGGPWQ
jgi:hypothetical protein